jgi:hypothetical protein
VVFDDRRGRLVQGVLAAPSELRLQAGDAQPALRGTSKGVPFVYAPDVEPYISNSGDLTRDKIAKLVEMVIDTAGS